MSQAILQGIAPNSWIPGPDFRVLRDERGLTTASQTYRCRKGDFAGGVIQTAFAKGNPIATIYPAVDLLYRFLEIDTAEATDTPGGITEISVNFKGFREGPGGTEFSREITFSRNNGLERKPIIEHPKFLEEVPSDTERAAIVAAYEGRAFKETGSSSSTFNVVDSLDKIVGNIYTLNAGKWWRRIIDGGMREYDAITSEWTKTGTNAGGLRKRDIENLGKIDSRPTGEPATPDGYTWRMTGCTESRSTGSASSYSITWTMIEYKYEDIEIYGRAT
jgi:hypothetical protein